MSLLIDAVRRTTITTYDIEASLTFYRDMLGMRVWYDGVFDDPAVPEVYDLPKNTKTRVCILQGGSDGEVKHHGMVSGMIGLLHFEGIPSPELPTPVKRPMPGEIIIMFGTTKMRDIEKRMVEGGYHLEGPPINLSTPGRKVVYELIGRDPNGVRVAFAQQSEIGPSLV